MEDAYKIIKRPLITEKSTIIKEMNNQLQIIRANQGDEVYNSILQAMGINEPGGEMPGAAPGRDPRMGFQLGEGTKKAIGALKQSFSAKGTPSYRNYQ